jgi:hypothetical protein
MPPNATKNAEMKSTAARDEAERITTAPEVSKVLHSLSEKHSDRTKKVGRTNPPDIKVSK